MASLHNSCLFVPWQSHVIHLWQVLGRKVSHPSLNSSRLLPYSQDSEPRGDSPALPPMGSHLLILLFPHRQWIFAPAERRFPTLSLVAWLVPLPGILGEGRFTAPFSMAWGFSFSWKQGLGDKCCVLVPQWQPITSFTCLPLKGAPNVPLPCSHFTYHHLVEAHEGDVSKNSHCVWSSHLF